MRKLKKYILVLFLIMSMAVILIGCGEVKVTSDTSINIDGTSDTKIKIYYDDTINKLVDNDLLSKVIDEVKDDMPDKIHFGEITKSKEGDLNTEEVNISTDKVKINEASNLNNDYFSIIEEKDKGLFTNEYKVTLKLNDSAIDIISDYINSNIPQIKVSIPDSTYLLWLDCRNLNLDGDDLVDFFVNKARLALNDGRLFGDGGDGYMRINIACPRKILEKALYQLENAVDSYNFEKYELISGC